MLVDTKGWKWCGELQSATAALQELGNWCWQYCQEQDARAVLQQPATPPAPGSGAEQRAADALAQHQVQHST